MLPVLICLFGSVALANMLIPEDSVEDSDDADENFEIDLALDDTIDLNQLYDDEMEISETSFDHDNLIDEELVLPQSTFQTDIGNFAPNEEMNVVEIDVAELPNALSDWTTSEHVTVVELGEGETLALSFPTEEAGSIIVVDANYFEMGNSSEGVSNIEHTGTNIYYVPEGIAFPSQYEWSTEGATFFNTSNYTNNPSDFGEIKLVARIDSGEILTVVDSDGLFLTTIDSSIGDPQIESNLQVRYL